MTYKRFFYLGIGLSLLYVIASLIIVVIAGLVKYTIGNWQPLSGAFWNTVFVIGIIAIWGALIKKKFFDKE